MTLVKDIFNSTHTMLNIVATADQLSNAYLVAYREFFAIVTPTIFIRNDIVAELLEAGIELTEGLEDTTDALGLGIGAFRIVETVEMIDHTAILIKPMDPETFKLDFNYVGAFQYVSEFFLKKVERDNMRMLKSAGIDDGEMFEEGDIIALRDYLKQSFSVISVGLVY